MSKNELGWQKFPLFFLYESHSWEQFRPGLLGKSPDVSLEGKAPAEEGGNVRLQDSVHQTKKDLRI